jgi:hypothetical protein
MSRKAKPDIPVQGTGKRITSKNPLLLVKAAGGFLLIRLAATDSPTGEGSTIGAPGLNDSVRNGKR